MKKKVANACAIWDLKVRTSRSRCQYTVTAKGHQHSLSTNLVKVNGRIERNVQRSNRRIDLFPRRSREE